MSAPTLVVLKFGSSVLRSEADLPQVAAEIRRHVARGYRVVAVVSAIGKSTEQLIRRAGVLRNGLGEEPTVPAATHGAPLAEGRRTRGHFAPSTEAAFAALLATGETTSAALVGLAVESAGVPCTVLCTGRVGPFTRGPLLDGQPHALDVGGIRRALEARPVAILPGFVGRDDEGCFSLLGRGGSDLTALFVAHSLQADRCRLLKDVDGIYEHNPATPGKRTPRRYEALDWAAALQLDDCILQHKASQFAYRHRLPFEVGSCGDRAGTRVGATNTRLANHGCSGASARTAEADAPCVGVKATAPCSDAMEGEPAS